MQAEQIPSQPAQAPTPEVRDPKKWEAARQFEALFLNEMFKSMRKTIPEDEEGGDSGNAMQMYTSMFDQSIADKVSGEHSVGLAELLYRQMQKLPGPAAVPPPKSVPSGGELDNWIDAAAKSEGVDPVLVRAVIQQESGGRSDAISPAGAKGLMQLMDSTAAEVGVNDSLDPRQNVVGGVRYLRKMLDRFDGDESLALAAYNAGPGAVERHGGIPPYQETRQYVRNVLAMRSKLAAGVDHDA